MQMDKQEGRGRQSDAGTLGGSKVVEGEGSQLSQL